MNKIETEYGTFILPELKGTKRQIELAEELRDSYINAHFEDVKNSAEILFANTMRKYKTGVEYPPYELIDNTHYHVLVVDHAGAIIGRLKENK